MALLNKLGEIVKSAAEKTEELTKTLGEKAEAALEIQRLNSQVNKERSKISDTHKKSVRSCGLNLKQAKKYRKNSRNTVLLSVKL
ncbi:MAG: hypothetical protein ACLVLP_10725 [Phascolarctobacterium faecium]|uniref:hypothetical protein n=1 Tax=Phascolarctobacterium faecium TaxID=33025 RepID=UPI00399AEA15